MRLEALLTSFNMSHSHFCDTVRILEENFRQSFLSRDTGLGIFQFEILGGFVFIFIFVRAAAVGGSIS